MSENEKQTEENEELQSDDGITPESSGENEEATAPEDVHLLLEDARNKADEHWNELLRLQAESENQRKRHARDLENAHKFGMEKFIQDVLPVWDSLAMGMTAARADNVNVGSVIEGMELTLKMMSDTMKKFNLEEIDPQGEPFDPEMHQAMSMLESADVAPNTVINVFQKGYRLNGRLIRPAMVVVSKAAAGEQDKKEQDTASKIDDQA
ncbi:MAG: nucleotide exchange factor GrpE [Gammaproteobacteria bacterium]|nr:nucleotide exchange factor GrpE [Gammaproteobacteria bacterium]